MDVPPPSGNPPPIAWEPGIQPNTQELVLSWQFYRNFWTILAPQACDDLVAAKTGQVVT